MAPAAATTDRTTFRPAARCRRSARTLRADRYEKESPGRLLCFLRRALFCFVCVCVCGFCKLGKAFTGLARNFFTKRQNGARPRELLVSASLDRAAATTTATATTSRLGRGNAGGVGDGVAAPFLVAPTR